MQNFLRNFKRFAALCFLSSSGMVYAQSSIEAFNSPSLKTPESSVVAPVKASSTAIFDCYWLGAVSQDWFNPDNWDFGLVPNSPMSNVTISAGMPNPPTLTGNVIIGNLFMDPGTSLNLGNFTFSVQGNATIPGEIKGTGGMISFNGSTHQILNSQGGKFSRLEFANGAGCTVNGSLEINDGIFLREGIVNNIAGDITFKSNQNGTAFINNFSPGFTGSLTSLVNYERYCKGNFRHIGAPVDGPFNSLNVSCLLIRTFDEENNAWIPVAPGCEHTNLYDDGGVTYTTGSSVATTNSYRGFPVSGTVFFPLRRTPSFPGGPQKGWNSLYNPYASPIDWDIAKNISSNSTHTNGAVWIWNSSTNNWATRSAAGVNVNGAKGVIAIGQGFLVRKLTSGIGGADFTLDGSCQLFQNTNHFIRSGEFNNNETIRFQLIGDNGSDETVVHLNAAATSEVDDFDAERPTSLGKSLELSTLASSGEKMMINAINAEGLKEMPLAISVPAAGSYKLILTENLSNQSVQILDLKTGRLTPAETGVTINASGEEEISSRFKLIFNSAKSDVASTFSAWAVNNHEIQIASLVENLSSVEIFNAVGQKVDFTAQSKGEGQASIRLANPTDGILLVRSGSHTERVVMTR